MASTRREMQEVLAAFDCAFGLKCGSLRVEEASAGNHDWVDFFFSHSLNFIIGQYSSSPEQRPSKPCCGLLWHDGIALLTHIMPFVSNLGACTMRRSPYKDSRTTLWRCRNSVARYAPDVGAPYPPGMSRCVDGPRQASSISCRPGPTRRPMVRCIRRGNERLARIMHGLGVDRCEHLVCEVPPLLIFPVGCWVWYRNTVR